MAKQFSQGHRHPRNLQHKTLKVKYIKNPKIKLKTNTIHTNIEIKEKLNHVILNININEIVTIRVGEGQGGGGDEQT